MDHEAGRLVNDDQVLILPQHLQRDLLGLHRDRDRRGFSEIDPVIEAQFGARFDDGPVHPHIAGAHEILQPGAREAGQPLSQEVIEPAAGERGICLEGNRLHAEPAAWRHAMRLAIGGSEWLPARSIRAEALMPEDPLPPTENCPTCGAEIDVTGLDPLTPVVCPACQVEFLSGRLLGDYELLDVLGRGGMGVVYRAMDRSLQRPVALKILRGEQAEDGVLSKLEEEAAVTASINHPNVVKVFTTGTTQGRFYIAMELVDKGTLDSLIELQGRVAEAQALEIAMQAAQGLRAANQHGLIHRDIKPGNILFSDAHTAKIVDFGLAIMEEASKGAGEIWGTPYYVSPERLEQKPEDFRGDMYSLGATIFHALAGRPPFEAEDATMVALKHLKSQAVSLQAFAPWVSGSTAFVINRMLSKDPAGRYSSYDELIEHLEYARDEIASGKAGTAQKKRVVLETDDDRKRWGYLTTAMIVVVLLLGAGAGAFFLFGGGPKQYSGPPETASVGAEGKNAAQYEAARKLLVDGKAAEAAPLFRALAVQNGTPQPLLQWSLLQSGLASLAAGKVEDGRKSFSELAAKPYQAKESAALSAFFGHAAALGSTPDPIAPDAVKGASPQSYESLLLLIAGLKDWELGQLEDGVALLRDFQSADPHGNYAWVAQYRSIASDDVSDYSDYRGAMALARDAHTPAQLQNAAKTLRKVATDLKRGGTLAAKLEQAAKAAEEKIHADAAKLDAEKKAVADAKGKVDALCHDGKLREALALIDGLKPSTADLLREQEYLRKKVGWLSDFEKESGTAVKGGDKKANLAQAIAKIGSDLPPEEAAARKWHAGVYALFTGQKAESRPLLEEAAALPPWSDYLPLLLPSRHSTLVKAPAGAPGEVIGNLFTAPLRPLIPDLTSTDIGLAATEKPGTTTADEKTGIITVRGGGADIYGTSDGFRFVHRPWTGDGQIIVRIEGIDRSHDFAKGGVMIRDGLGANAKMAFLGVAPNGSLASEIRKETGGKTVEQKDTGFAAPVWLKLVRAGKTFLGFASRDGRDWKQVSKETIEMGPEAEAGLAISAHDINKQNNLRVSVSVFGK